MSSYGRIVVRGSSVFLHVSGQCFVYNAQSRPVGEGAMGTVYSGINCETRERVAIKKIREEFASYPQIRKRAALEASLVFRHKNLVEMVGICEESPTAGSIYIISKYVNGETLDKFVAKTLRGTTDSVKKICETMYPVLDALDYLHGKNIVHMDVKPSNIMVEMGRNIRLMDLGIAYASGIQEGKSGLVGTPRYAAPEQVIGADGPGINQTTDIYEAGVTLYELLTGNNPYDAPTKDEVICRHRTLSLPSDTRVPESLLGVLRKATSVSQSDRYASASEFKAAIEDSLTVRKSDGVKVMYAVLAVLLCLILLCVVLIFK